jgi:hypothetical protein
MSRYTRRPRRPRKATRAKRNTGGYGLIGEELEERGKAAQGPELVVFPINPISLRWASEVYLAQQDLSTYQADVLHFMELIGESEELDEETLGRRVLDVLSSPKSDRVRVEHLAGKWKGPKGSAYPVPHNESAALQDAAERVFQRVGTYEELASMQPLPDFGLLQGQGVLDAGLVPSGTDGDLKSRFKDRVLALDAKVQKARAGIGYPIEEIGRASADRVSGLFLGMGPWEDVHGMALMPPAADNRTSARTAAGLVRAILVRRLWDVKTMNWAKGGKISWALPQSLVDKRGRDATRTQDLVNFICVRENMFQGPGIEVRLAYSADGRQVVARLAQGEAVQQIRGSFNPKQREYVFPQGIALKPVEEKMFLRSGDTEVELGFVSSHRSYPGAKSYLLEPQVIEWLRSGVELLSARPARAEEDAARALGSEYELISVVLSQLSGRALSTGEVIGILRKFYDSLAQVPMGFVGNLQGADGISRYLPTDAATSEGRPSWYGSSAEDRAMMAQRTGKRAQLSGKTRSSLLKTEKGGRPLPLLAMQLLAEADKRPYAANLKAIQFLRAEMTMAMATAIDPEDRTKLEQKLFDTGTAAGAAWVPPASLPLTGASPLCSAIFSLYGLNESGEYTVLWQNATAMPYGEIAAIVQETHKQEGDYGEEEGSVFHPVLALRRWLAIESGLIERMEHLQSSDKVLLAPFCLVGALTVDQTAIAKGRMLGRRLVDGEWVTPRPLPRALGLGQGPCGSRTTQLGLMLTQIYLGNDPEELRVVHSAERSAEGLRPTQASMGDYWTLAESFIQVGVTKARHLAPLAGEKSDLFSFRNIEQTEAFRYKLAARQEKALAEAFESGEPPEEVDPQLVYYAVLQEKLLPAYGSGVTAAVRGGRRALSAFGGSQSRIVSADPSRRVWGAKKSSMYMDVFNFAAGVCRQVGCVPHGPRRTEAGPGKKWKDNLSNMKSDENDIVHRLAEYGILESVDLDDPVSVREGLIRLRAALRPSYSHKTRLGLVPDQLAERAAAIEGIEDLFPDEEGVNAFAQDYFSEMAKPNGRRARRPRRPRRSRRNPLNQYEVEEAVAYAAQRRGERTPGELPGAFERVTRDKPSADWELSEARVAAMFPRKFAGKGTWSPANRLKTLETTDLVSRVGAIDPHSPLVRAGQAGVMGKKMPIDDAAVRALMMAEAGLSLDEAIRILAEQQGKKSTGWTMAPSSAICKMYRTRRLTAYRIPRAVLDRVGDQAVLIWMSPAESHHPRVMSYRRSTHIDCDMGTKKDGPEAMPELLGRSLQSAMYWVAEKGRRAAVTDIWVGRVGQPNLSLALPRGETITLANVAKNLRLAEEGVDSYRVSIYGEGNGYRELGEDSKAYMLALRAQIGADAAREAAAQTETQNIVVSQATPGDTSLDEGDLFDAMDAIIDV